VAITDWSVSFEGAMKYKYTKSLETKASYDVIVAGGGTAGVVAAIASAGNGANTLLVERTGALGGMMTVGNCGLTCYILHASEISDQYIVEEMLNNEPEKAQVIGGLPMEITHRLLERSGALATEGNAGSYVFTDQFEFRALLNEMIREAGVQVLFHTTLIDAVIEENKIKGAILHNKEGLSLYEAKVFIDATGDGDLCALAGAEFFTGIGKYDLVYEENPEVLGTLASMGVMFRVGSTDVLKTLEYLKDRKDSPTFEVQIMSLQDYETVVDCIQRKQMTTFVIKGFDFGGLQVYNSPDPSILILGCPCIRGNGLDPLDKSSAELEMTELIGCFMEEIRRVPGFENSTVIDVPEIGVRETRHIVGEYILGLKDILQMKDFEDSIGRGSHLIDISPVPSWLKKDELPKMFSYSIPFRSLMVKGFENLMVAGRCISATHEASGSIRVTVQCMVTGEAAGTAAALCIEHDKNVRDLDFGVILEKLLDNGVKV